MEVKIDYQSVVEEVKERNRLFLALQQVREIAIASNIENVSEEAKKQFELIVQKCDEVLVTSK
jgi:hypothetical protein